MQQMRLTTIRLAIVEQMVRNLGKVRFATIRFQQYRIDPQTKISNSSVLALTQYLFQIY
jgi:hypothetical protein